MAKTKAQNNDTGANHGFDARLWRTADALRLKLISGKLRVKHAERFIKEAN